MKTAIVKISEGLGNQLFMYAHAYAFAKKKGYKLLIDSTSGYKKIKIRNFLLDNFNIKINLAKPSDIPDNFFNYIKFKIDKNLDKFRFKKKFLTEIKNQNKKTKYYDYSKFNYSNKLFIEGYFESEKFFKDYKNDIFNCFKLKNIDENKLYLDPKILKNENSVSIVIRQHRFSEKLNSLNNIKKSDLFVKKTINYILEATEIIKSKIKNPKFYIFSNDIQNLNNLLDEDCFTIINHKDNKPINDFYLSTMCRHFIVGPSTFHWWSAYLSDNSNKICIRPDDKIQFSSNENIYPDEWLKIKV